MGRMQSDRSGQARISVRVDTDLKEDYRASVNNMSDDLREHITTVAESAERDVNPLLVLDWGGWEDLDTFIDHYRGTYSPEAQRRERQKVDWL